MERLALSQSRDFGTPSESARFEEKQHAVLTRVALLLSSTAEVCAPELGKPPWTRWVVSTSATVTSPFCRYAEATSRGARNRA
jgi:hypothetical protein